MIKELFAPGRTELSGNHTDHQNGRILASAVTDGLFAKAEPNGENVIRIQSDGYKSFEVRLDHMSVRTREFGTPKAMTRGVAAEFRALGLNVGGLTPLFAVRSPQAPACHPRRPSACWWQRYSMSYLTAALFSPLLSPVQRRVRRINSSASPAA